FWREWPLWFIKGYWAYDFGLLFWAYDPELADDEIVAGDQPYAEDASPMAHSPDEEDDDEDPEEDPIDYSADGGDDGDDEMDIEEDEDDDMDIETDE
ncbi:hypothetical protein Tco_0571907, partial [Tanacetum coccineum]